MDNTAIALIQNTAIDANTVINGRLPDHIVAMPRDYQVHDFEKNELGRTRYRGAFATASMPDFIAYVKAKASIELGGDSDSVVLTEGFIDAEKHSARVFFNLGDEAKPGHGDWTATLALRATAAYRAFQAIEGQKLTQRALIDWLEDWGRNVYAIEDEAGANMSLPLAVTAFRKLTIASKKDSVHVDDQRKASRSSFEQVEAAAAGQFPDRLTFKAVPFLGLPERTFYLRVGILTDHDEPRIVLRAVAKEEQEEAIAQDFKDALEAGLGQASSLTVGAFTP